MVKNSFCKLFKNSELELTSLTDNWLTPIQLPNLLLHVIVTLVKISNQNGITHVMALLSLIHKKNNHTNKQTNICLI